MEWVDLVRCVWMNKGQAVRQPLLTKKLLRTHFSQSPCYGCTIYVALFIRDIIEPRCSKSLERSCNEVLSFKLLNFLKDTPKNICWGSLSVVRLRNNATCVSIPTRYGNPVTSVLYLTTIYLWSIRSALTPLARRKTTNRPRHFHWPVSSIDTGITSPPLK